MTEYDATIVVLQAISDSGPVTAPAITAQIEKICLIHERYVAYLTGYLIKIGLVVGYLGRNGELVFQLA